MYQTAQREKIFAPRWRPFVGDLITIRFAVNSTGELPVLGIIIKCSHPSFGFGGEEYFDVLVQGRLMNVSELMIWPLEEEF